MFTDRIKGGAKFCDTKFEKSCEKIISTLMVEGVRGWNQNSFAQLYILRRKYLKINSYLSTSPIGSSL